GAQQLEVFRHGAVDDVGGVGVPGDADARMVSVLHHRAHVRRMGGAGAVHFHPDFDVVIGSHAPASGEGPADLLQGTFNGHALGQSVRADLDAFAADVGGELDEVAAGIDVLLH